MSTTPASPPVDGIPEAELEGVLELAFAPLHKRAFGMACGLALGVSVALATLVFLLRAQPGDGQGMWLLAQYFRGYRVTPVGALVGFAWGAFVGFIGGWFVAFCRNLAIAITVFVLRVKAELTQTRDFLDHI